jgi:hypothetical protein
MNKQSVRVLQGAGRIERSIHLLLDVAQPRVAGKVWDEPFVVYVVQVPVLIQSPQASIAILIIVRYCQVAVHVAEKGGMPGAERKVLV